MPPGRRVNPCPGAPGRAFVLMAARINLLLVVAIVVLAVMMTRG